MLTDVLQFVHELWSRCCDSHPKNLDLGLRTSAFGLLEYLLVMRPDHQSYTTAPFYGSG